MRECLAREHSLQIPYYWNARLIESRGEREVIISGPQPDNNHSILDEGYVALQ